MRVRIAILITCLSLIVAGVSAHGGEVHVIGTVARVAEDSIAVKTAENKTVAVRVAAETRFIKAQAEAKSSDLKVGDRVVIHAKQSGDGSLVADTVEFAAARASQESKTLTLTGVVSDSACGATHGMKGMAAADCTRMCIKAGQKYALVVGKSLYILQGHEAELDKLAGERATVKGSLSGKTVSVTSVAPTKKG